MVRQRPAAALKEAGYLALTEKERILTAVMA